MRINELRKVQTESLEVWIEIIQFRFSRNRPALNPKVGRVISQPYRTGRKGPQGQPEFNWYCDVDFNGRIERVQVQRIKLAEPSKESEVA